MKSIYIVFVLLIIFSCSEKKEEMLTISFEECVSKEKEMQLSAIADTLEYLELKTPDDIVVSRIVNILQSDDFWIIQTPNNIYKFSKEGSFIKEIGRRGQGPEEYIHILATDIDYERKEIIQADVQKILYYDYEGNVLRTTKINDYFFNLVVSDSIFWTCNLCMHVDKYMACAINRSGDTIAVVPNPNYGMKSLNTDGFYFNSPFYLREFSKYDGSLYMKTRSSRDTVYQISGINRVPYLYFDMGKYKMPVEYEIWYSKEAYERNADNYWNIPRMNEDEQYIYIIASRQKPKNEEKDNDEDYKFIVYDKDKKDGFVTKGRNGNKITDDILGGPSFWMSWMSDEYYISAVEFSDFKEIVEGGDYELSPMLNKQYENWNEDTNQLVVLARKIKKL